MIRKQVEYIARLVEEEDLPEEDKKEGVKGMMEGFIMASRCSLYFHHDLSE